MAVSEDAQLTPALEAMPVFPLPGVVLFPGALLPLHIFEPRYRALLADALATHRHMALAFVRMEDGVPDLVENPRFERVAGAGLIVEHSALPDGRSNIVLQGRARVALEELPFLPPYRRARARVLADRSTPLSSIDRTALHAAATALASASRRADRKTDFALPPGIGAGPAADLCAHQLIVDPAMRQRILEELDVAARVRLVTAALAEQLVRAKREAKGRPD
jgi:ATP-dependent Lon protease